MVLEALRRRLVPVSLQWQLTLALLLLFLFGGATIIFTLYELNLRKHDYVILNLSGQLRAISQTMVELSLRYAHETPRLDEQAYLAEVNAQADRYQHIVSSLQKRLLQPELTGRSDPLLCSWDDQSSRQLNLTAENWGDFQRGLQDSSVKGGAAVANYILDNARQVEVVSSNLSTAFQVMMEGKMALIVLFNKILLGVALLLLLVLFTLLHFTFVRPLRMTIRGIRRISQGEFGYTIPVRGGNEIAQMTHAFNHLSQRINAIARLTERLDAARSLDEMVRFAFEEFRLLLPIDWVGLLSLNHVGDGFQLEHWHAQRQTPFEIGTRFPLEGTLLAEAHFSGKPLHIPNLAEEGERNPKAEFVAALSRDGFGSALLFPVGRDHHEGSWSALLVFASLTPSAYRPEHIELLHNIATQVSQGVAKTVLAENLVISAVSGLAKLAESRDSETGGHLTRMALYAATIAEELNREGRYAGLFPPEQVRNIHRFAPMHDIGKVGIADSVLLKSGRLSEDEWVLMEKHPAIGGEVLRRCEAQMNAVGYSIFQIGIEIAEGHHEHYDGSGYPHHLVGDAIPLSARVVSVADVFDALTSKRPYKAAWGINDAVAEMERQAGHHFDLEVIAGFKRALPRLLVIYERLKHV